MINTVVETEERIEESRKTTYGKEEDKHNQLYRKNKRKAGG